MVGEEALVNGEDFSDRFIAGTSGHPEHELRLVIAMGVERALRDRGYRVDQSTIAATLREAADLLTPTLSPARPWWAWWAR